MALLHLANYFVSDGSSDKLSDIELAAQHARHAVSIEYHPFALTTLGKILLAQMNMKEFSMASSYTEAYEKLTEAISLEKSWSRKAIQPYVLLFRGTTDFLIRGGVLSIKQLDAVQTLMKDGERVFGRDKEMEDSLLGLRRALSL